MTLFFRLLMVIAIISVSACASSGRAPVVEVGSRSSEPVSVDGQTVDGGTAPNTDVYIESTPLPSNGSLERQTVRKNSRTAVSPVVKKLLQQAEQARARQDWSQSEVYLERALRISPKSALVWHRMSLLKLEQNKNNQAIQFASKSNTLARSDNGLRRRNWSVIAEANTALGRPLKAIEARRKSQGY